MSGAKSSGGTKDYYGHCAGKVCQGQLDFIWGLMIENELVWPDAFIWDSQIFKQNRKIVYTDGNAYQTPNETDQVPPNFPWVIIAFAWVAGSYAINTLVVANGNMVFKSLINANATVPPATATSNADWQYQYTPDLWTAISGGHFWTAGSIVAWEGQLYMTASDTNAEPPNAPWTLWRQMAGANPLKMTVHKSSHYGTNAGPGDWYLYWGTPNQVLDVAGEQVLNGLGHPPYRNNAVLVGKDVLFGTETVTPPSVQVLGGRSPVQSIIINNTGVVGVDATAMDADWQVNPWCVLAEMLTHPIYGLGLPATWFNTVSWQAEADRCALNPQLFYISPMYTSLKKVSELVADLLSYPDAFIFWSTIATLTAGHWPHGEAAPAFTNANTVNQDCITKEFATDSEGFWGTYNSVAVSIQDIQAAFKSRPAIAPNLFNMAVTKRVLTQKIDRPHIVRFNQGLQWATEFAKIAGDQVSKGTIELQAEKATGILPGSLFLLTDDQFGFSEIQRCTRRVVKALPTGKVELTHETERGVAPVPYSPTSVLSAPASGPSPSLITNYQLVQLPTSLAGKGSTIALLAGRQDEVTTALQIWFQQADQAAFQLLGTNGAFAVAGTVTVDGGVQVPAVLTTNSAMGTTYNLPAGTVSLNLGLVFYNNLGVFLGAGVYGTDFTVDLINDTVTILNTSTFPNGSTVTAAPMIGVLATDNSTQGNTYNIPTNWWTPILVYRMTAAGVAGYAGGLGGATVCIEGTDYLIDPAGGTFTILSGGNIANGDTVFIQFTTFMLCQFATNTPANDIEAISATLTQDEINDNDLLMFVFQKADPSKFEIMSVTAVTAMTPTTFPVPANPYYTIAMKREQYGTLFGGDGSYVFTGGDPFFIIPRSALNVLSHQAFQGLEETGESANFILAPQSAWVDAQITDLYDIANNPTGLSLEFAYTFDNLFAPSATWIQQLKAAAGTLPANGTTIASFAGTFLTTDQFYFSFQLNAPPGANIISASLQGMVGEQQLTLWSNVFTPSAQVNSAAQFSLANAGLWSLSLNVLCDDGSQISAPLTLVGGPNTPVQIQVNTPTVTYAPTPTLKSYNKTRTTINAVKLSAPTGDTVKYQLQNRGTAYNAGAWTALTESPGGSGTYIGVANFLTGAKTLYAYTHDGVNTDSPVASWNL